MELKEYQQNALDAFARWRDALDEERANSEKLETTLRCAGLEIPDGIGDYPAKAWQKLAERGGLPETAGPYASRTDDAGRPIPHVCLKVPTGGGKTLLAAEALARLPTQTGLRLWITPTRAIYQQTWNALRNREHPYRQVLDRASGGRVKLLEKDDRFTLQDTRHYLCVMLLMLPAANRQKGRDFLRMFRDSGKYPTFFPDEDAPLGDGEMTEQFPDLDRAGKDGPVKHSLFNVFKTLRPVVILDEAHKAYGIRRKGANQEFVRSVNRLDPRMVIELSATPNRGISNLLVDITGVELKREEMIKLPVRVESFTNAEWQYTLAQARDRLDRLEAEARALQTAEGRCIRPIAVVRTERTGKDQRDGERVHSEDVREYLTRNLGVPAEAVAVKSSELDELSGVDLMSESSTIRWIITKAALMEGWDCPFAYVLVMLDNTRAQNAITQLVGRVMRQPHARQTARQPLDRCYVYCWNTDVGKAVQQVKLGLEREGLTGLGDIVFSDSAEVSRIQVQRRQPHQGADIFLPKVNHRDGDGWIELDYQRHILPAIDWDAISAPSPQDSIAEGPRRHSATVDLVDASTSIRDPREIYIDKTIRLEWFARRLSDLVPNAWQAARIARDLVNNLRAADQTDADIYDRRAYIEDQLRRHIADAIEKRAERVFQRKLDDGDIRFDLEIGKPNFQLEQGYEIPVNPDMGAMLRRDGRPIQMSLFEPVYSQHYNTLERRFAQYLDEAKALQWWHRVAVRQSRDYYLKGWKRERIWPDFVAMAQSRDGKPHLLVFETKGDHLDGNPDTEYKKRVMKTLQTAFNSPGKGVMTIRDGPAKGTFRLVFENEIPQALSGLTAAYNPRPPDD